MGHSAGAGRLRAFYQAWLGYHAAVFTATRYETVELDRQRHFEAYCTVPEAGVGPGIILFQEIFGINDNMRAVGEQLAARGFVTFVPDIFWRIEPRFERKDESGMADAFAVVQKFDFAAAAADIRATHAHLLAMQECSGRVGVLGFCLGGGLAFAAATMSRVDGRGPDAAVCYYGSAIDGMLDRVDDLDCPTLLHYGNSDGDISTEQIDAVAN